MLKSIQCIALCFLVWKGEPDKNKQFIKIILDPQEIRDNQTKQEELRFPFFSCYQVVLNHQLFASLITAWVH